MKMIKIKQFIYTDFRYIQRQVKNVLIIFVNRYLLFKGNYALVDKNQFVGHTKSISEIINLGIEILTVYDIGAHNGNFSRHLQKWLPRSKFYLFEASIKHKKALQELGFDFVIALLGEKNQQAEFYEIGGTGDSQFKENSEIYSNVQPNILEVTTLDQVIQEKNWPAPDLIKIDTQGSELLILEGAINTLPQVKAILVETQFYSTPNENSPLFTAIIDFLEPYGFLVFDIAEIHRSRLGIAQIDFLFIRRELLIN
jgi:FkbM family methyltransferase